MRLIAENSIFIFACIKDNIEELTSCNIVKNEAIIIDKIAKLESYPGIKKAIKVDRNNMTIHKISLKVITFQTIFDDSFGLFEISLIDIA